MEFFSNLSLGYQIMLVGIAVFFVGIIVMFLESINSKKSSKQIKNEYLMKNNVRTCENSIYSNNTSDSINPYVDDSITDISQLNDNENLSDLINMNK